MREKRCNGKKGVVLVEIAIILPLIVILLVGMLEFGVLFHNYLKVQKATREGARYAALGISEVGIAQRIQDYSTNLDPGQMTINVTNAQGARGEPVVVQVRYDLQLITPLMEGLAGQNPCPLNSRITMRLE